MADLDPACVRVSDPRAIDAAGTARAGAITY